MVITYVVDTVPEVIKILQEYGTRPAVTEVNVNKIVKRSGTSWYEVNIIEGV